jgi:hypothetical protein
MKRLLLILFYITTFSSIVGNSAIIYNNSTSPIFVWPIPEKNTPGMIARIPNRAPDVITTPAKISWPGSASSLVVIADKGNNGAIFQKIVDQLVYEYTRIYHSPSNYNWAEKVWIALYNNAQWSSGDAFEIFYQKGSLTGAASAKALLEPIKDFKLVIYTTKGAHNNLFFHGASAAIDSPDAKDLENKYKSTE